VGFLVSTLAPFCSHLGIGGTGCSSASNIVEYLGLDPSPWEAMQQAWEKLLGFVKFWAKASQSQPLAEVIG
jgi:hydroxymethylpyrimidine/phosphomethylpyrimidine kinase